MKHLRSGLCGLLSDLIAEAGLEVSEEAQSLALRHLDWVLEQNLTLNLTSVTDPSDAVRLHTLDSLMALTEIVDAPEGTMVDLGSGAGFPGIPLALASGRTALLLDSVGKKARAVEQFVRDSGLERTIAVWPRRAEEIDLESAGLAGMVVARAVSSLPSLVELASPLLRAGGWLVAMKGRADEAEVRRGQEAGKIGGHATADTARVRSAGRGRAQVRLRVRACGGSPVRLPRSDGSRAASAFGMRKGSPFGVGRL